MSIPTIERYQIDSCNLSVVNKVNWVQDNSRTVLLIHDMQKYFVDLFPDVVKSLLIENCDRLIRFAREKGIPIIYSAQPGDMSKKDRGLLADFWGSGMTRAPRHSQIVDELKPHESDVILNKWRYSAFHNTNLDNLFLESNRDQVIICGVFAHIGILTSAIDAYSRDIEVFLVQDAIADFTEKDHIHAINHAAKCCATVLTAKDVCR